MTERTTQRDGYTIETSYGPCQWYAHLDSYDGAPDARGKNSLVGFGSTEQNAIDDLLSMLGDEE